ncbi:ribonuclease H-like domain-containing protein [Tanacetum coccineum]
MKQIIMVRSNGKPDSFAEADFKYLNKNNIEDLYYLCRSNKVVVFAVQLWFKIFLIFVVIIGSWEAFMHCNTFHALLLVSENYKVWSAAVDLALHTRNKIGFINGKSVREEKTGPLQEQWDRLMQLLMGLDDVFNSVRSIIPTTEPIPDVKYAFATLSRDESHRNSYSTSKDVKTGSAAFIARSSNGNSNNNWNSNRNNNSNSRNRRFGRVLNLVFKHCNMTGHTIDRCFELVGYPSGFKKNNELMSLLSDAGNASTSHVSVAGASQHITYYATFLYDIIDVTHMNLTVSHPNGTVEHVKQIGNFKLRNNLILKDVLVIRGYKAVSAQMVAAAKLPVLNPNEIELWKIRMEQ